jgi:hypothetical protein
MPSLSQKKWLIFVRCGFALLLLQFCGCASHLATVKTEPARFPTGLRVEEPLGSAIKYLLAAEHEQPSAALGHDLLAAKISYGVLERQPKDESARRSITSPWRAWPRMSTEQMLSRGGIPSLS